MDNMMAEPEKPVAFSLRASSIPLWLGCSKRAESEYLAKKSEPCDQEEGVSPVARLAGSLTHKLVTGHKTTCPDDLRISFDKITQAKPQLDAHIKSMAARAKNWLEQEGFETVSGEEQMLVKVPFPGLELTLTGSYDMIVAKEGMRYLLDLKTGNKPDYSFPQLAIYTYLYNHIHEDKKVDFGGLLWVKRGSSAPALADIRSAESLTLAAQDIIKHLGGVLLNGSSSSPSSFWCANCPSPCALRSFQTGVKT